MIVYCDKISPRLQYISDFISTEIIGKAFELTTSKETFIGYDGPGINYSNEEIRDCKFQIKNHGLLTETGLTPLEITCFEENGYKAFFKTEGDFPFDIFAASFYLLSRYEEYLPHTKDMYGRYAHENSLAFKANFLHLPIVNLWLEEFKKVLRSKFPDLQFAKTAFRFVPTYDIDIAYSYLHKGFWRNTGGFLRSALTGRWAVFRERRNVLRGKIKDPYDTYVWMDRLHEQHNLKPYYFFLVTSRTGKYDKNISPANSSMEKLIQHHYYRYPVGVHPSWQSGDHENLLNKEIGRLQQITGGEILASRQHYIRFSLPGTFRKLVAAGIRYDFSMGYGSINGFRASIASPFYWYDLVKEEQTPLQLFPFCYMEANSFYEQQDTPAMALEEMQHYYAITKQVNGLMITIWHNHFFGTDKKFEGWKETYEEFIKKVSNTF